ncbi:hypothetical protein KXD40_009452 [Peronospora effusa]|nr:hypothetical protein KXD40_009452 [Peronospora effusa]
MQALIPVALTKTWIAASLHPLSRALSLCDRCTRTDSVDRTADGAEQLSPLTIAMLALAL